MTFLQKKLSIALLCLFFFQILSFSQTVSGDLKQYHKTTLTFNGPNLSEAPETYLNYRMNVTITAPSSATYVVPGYFAADGNAAETSASSGNKWRCHFTPKEVGRHTYSVSFRTGTNVAVNTSPTAGSTSSIDGVSGNFTIDPTNVTGNDYRAKGKLQYNGTDTAVFDNGSYYFEVGADSPETFLEYSDFDATPARHDFSEVANNYRNGDPSWQNGKGTEIIGAVNYLANQGMNVHYFLTMNITGDGDRTYPFPNNTSYRTYDVSKLDQWQIVFDHMYNKGMVQELVLTEQENLHWFERKENVSDANFSNSRKLYYREMIARFGYLNVVYNIGEEASWDRNATKTRYTAAQIEEAAGYIQEVSAYNDLISVHNGPSNDFSVFPELTALGGKSNLTAISFQGNYGEFSHGHDEIKTVKDLASADGKEWVVRYTEPFGTTSNPEPWTENSLWATITAGATGIHYFRGGSSDQDNDDYRLYSDFYERMKFAKEFLEDNNIPFWNMYNDNSLINKETLLTDGSNYYVAFLPDGGTATIDLDSGNFDVKWFDPRNGGTLKDGNITSVSGGMNVSFGNPPNSTSSSWVVLVKNQNINNNNNIAVTGISISSNSTQISLGNTTQLTASISPSNATNKFVTWTSSNNSIASVNSSGIVTANAQGTATITATTNDGGFSDTSSITVSDSTSSNCSADYEEVDNMVVIEAENINQNEWETKSRDSEFTGSGYIEWGKGDFFNDPGNGLISIKIKINNTGIYRLQWRSKAGEGDSTTEENDSWVRFPDASLQFGAKDDENGSRIYAHGSGLSPTPNGSGSDNWWKVYVNSLNWNWKTATSDRDAHNIYVQFDNPGIYTMEISARSSHHFIDRIVLYKSSVNNPTNLSLSETPCNDDNNNFVNVTGIQVSPNNSQITIGNTVLLTGSITPTNATNKDVTWASSNNNIATVDGNGLVTAISEGTVTITSTSNDGGFSDTATINVSDNSNNTSCDNVNLNAVNDFTNRNISGFAPAYIDNNRNALAINASNYKDQFAAATTTFNGDTGSYNIIINTLRELDGESSYRMFIDNVLIGTFQNPTTSTDYAPASQTFRDVFVENNATIRVEFNSHTNGLIPEGNSTAYSRGRWTSLEFNCVNILSTEDFFVDTNFKVYPNPTNSSDNVYLIGLKGESYVVSIYDLVGKLIERKNLKFNNNTGELNIGYLKSGLYMLTAADGSNVYFTKLVVR